MTRARLGTVIVIGLMAGVGSVVAQDRGATPPAATPPAPAARPAPPTRDPHTPGYVAAKELPDGTIPTANDEGNFIIGATHNPAPEMTVQEGVPHGTVSIFEMKSTDSKIYPGIARDQGTFGVPDPANPAKLDVTTSHPAPYTRRVAVYVPQQYVPGTVAPFIVGADGPDQLLFTALDNLIAQKRVPVMIGISISNGSGDAQGSQRGLEYDTMSGLYAEFVEKEVLPLVEKQYNVKLTKNPEGRATTGCSSGGSAALEMAWYHTDLYHRVLTYSGTYVNQQWPHNPATPGGAWEFHRTLIPNSPAKPIRIWMQVGDRDLLNPNVMRDEMHDWVLANEGMAKVLAARKYHYQFVFARNAGHCDRATKLQTLPMALEWLWKGYPMKRGQKAPKDIDEDIAGAPKDVQMMLKGIRRTIRKAAPKAEEAIKYGMPTFVLNGNLVHFAAFKNHIGFYPAPRGIERFKAELSAYEGAKGTVRFPLDKPLPLGLIGRIVKFRVKTNLER